MPTAQKDGVGHGSRKAQTAQCPSADEGRARGGPSTPRGGVTARHTPHATVRDIGSGWETV